MILSSVVSSLPSKSTNKARSKMTSQLTVVGVFSLLPCTIGQCESLHTKIHQPCLHQTGLINPTVRSNTPGSTEKLWVCACERVCLFLGGGGENEGNRK